jgi:hypothetical protein
MADILNGIMRYYVTFIAGCKVHKTPARNRLNVSKRIPEKLDLLFTDVFLNQMQENYWTSNTHR